jgi:hypothetical protein
VCGFVSLFIESRCKVRLFVSNAERTHSARDSITAPADSWERENLFKHATTMLLNAKTLLPLPNGGWRSAPAVQGLLQIFPCCFPHRTESQRLAELLAASALRLVRHPVIYHHGKIRFVSTPAATVDPTGCFGSCFQWVSTRITWGGG